MGVIKRQSIKQSIVSYFGVLIGITSTLFIYPLNLEIYGFVQFLLGTASLLVPFLNFGVAFLAVRFFPLESEKNNDRGFLTLLIYLSLIIFIITSSLLLIFKIDFIEFLLFFKIIQNKSITIYFKDIIVLSFLLIFINLLSYYISNYLRIVIPNILNNIFFKIVLPILVFLHFRALIDEKVFTNLLLTSHFLSLIALLIYTLKIGNVTFKIDKSIITKKISLEMFRYSSIAIIGGLGSILVFRLDAIMISSMIDFKSAGIYSVMLFLANVIELPAKSIDSISAPIISSSWKTNDTATIFNIYQKSTFNLLIIGLILFVLISTNLNDILKLTTNSSNLDLGKFAFIYLGLAKIIDTVTGLNNQIIGQSKYYSFNLIAIAFLGILSVVTNYFFIQVFGIVGAAMATLISLSFFNLMKFIFIWYKFKMQPFNTKHLQAILIIAVAGGASFLVPQIDIILVPIVLKSSIIV